MKLRPPQAPLYGNCVLTVELSDDEDEEEEEEEGAEFFLSLAGSAQTHLTSVVKISPAMFQAVCPAHDCCEWVLVTLCRAGADGRPRCLSSTCGLSFVQDVAFDMAQFLVSAAGQTALLEEHLLLEEHHVPPQESEKLDRSLSLALAHLTLPPTWSLMGNNTGSDPQETLLHFAARRGLARVAAFLLRQRGAAEALSLENKQGATPENIARSRGHTALLQLFSQESETWRRTSPEASVMQHHPLLNTFTLSVCAEPGHAPHALQTHILQLRSRRQQSCLRGGVALQDDPGDLAPPSAQQNRQPSEASLGVYQEKHDDLSAGEPEEPKENQRSEEDQERSQLGEMGSTESSDPEARTDVEETTPEHSEDRSTADVLEDLDSHSPETCCSEELSRSVQGFTLFPEASEVVVWSVPADVEIVMPRTSENELMMETSAGCADEPECPCDPLRSERSEVAEDAQQTDTAHSGGRELLKEASEDLKDLRSFTSETSPAVVEENTPVIHRERDASSQTTSPSQKIRTSASPDLQPCFSETDTYRDSGSDTDGFLSPDAADDSVFRKGAEHVGGGDSTSEVSVSCSSADDTTSTERPSSSAESSEEARLVGVAQDEAQDRLTEVSAFHRRRPLASFRRHSWGPGKIQGAEPDMSQRSSARGPGEEKPIIYRRSVSWCPRDPCPHLEEIRQLISYSLDGLAAEVKDRKRWLGRSREGQSGVKRTDGEERGSLTSLTEEGPETDSSIIGPKSRKFHQFRHGPPSVTLPLQKSVSMLSISQRDLDAVGRIRRRRHISFTFNLSPILPKSKSVFTLSSSSSDEEDSISLTSFTSSMGYSITEEEPGASRCHAEKGSTKVSRTFSYLKSKMYRKTRAKEKEKVGEKEKDMSDSGHSFGTSAFLHPALCPQCSTSLNTKDALTCTSCNLRVHKSCRDNLSVCSKARMKQLAIPETTIMPVVTLRTKPSTLRERPWSAIFSPEEHSLIVPSRRPTSIMPFHSSNLSKSMSINNITMFEEMPLRGMRYLSQSTDSLQKPSKVTASNESLDEGAEVMDSRLMGEFEAEVKELDADSWSVTVDQQRLKHLKKDVVKRQDVIYELIQTEMHHLRTLRIMADVYSKGLLLDLQMEGQLVEMMFPMLDELLEFHSSFFSALLDRKKESRLDGLDGGFLIHRIGDVLLNQFSGSNAESMKRIYSRFCSRHNEAVNFYKELQARDKRFQAFVKRKMSSSVVRRLGVSECILLVTQRITKYPVLLQRILQHTHETEEDWQDLTRALALLKDVVAAVDARVNEHQKKKKLKEIYTRTDSKSITRMKSGQMFAREDLLRSGKMLHEGALQLKNAAGRLKDVHALLLSDVFVFLQEKDQKYVFASLDQRATVISLQKLIVREVAQEERGLFLITAGIQQPEMVEVLTSSREERSTWMQLIQDAMHSIEKDDDEGIPSETEEDKKLLETKTKEMRDSLQRKDEQIVSLLLEKMKLFHHICGSSDSDASAMLFRASKEEVGRGEPIMRDALREVETLQALVNSSLGGVVGLQVTSDPGNMAPVCLPRRAETFGGFDSQNTCKYGDKDEAEDLRRTESDGVLKKGGNTNLLHLLKRNSEQVLSSVTHLHDLLTSLQAVVLQQDTFIEDQRQALSERPPPPRPSPRPPSLVEQEKQRSLERHRQEAAALQRQQTAHAEERRRREREWEGRERQLSEREVLLQAREEEAGRRRREVEEARAELRGRKEEYQRDLERLRDAQRRLERQREQTQQEAEQLRQLEVRLHRTPSSTSDDSLKLQEAELSCSPRKNSLPRPDGRHKGRGLFSLGGKAASLEGQSQMPARLLQLATSRGKKEKKKKKSKSQSPPDAASRLLPLAEPPVDGEIFFC